ncbi:MAG: NAD(P)/FAD-dependent oxidoreductase [Sphingomonadaceae bacterium]|nr:NAD(P)/FAD-dependent oxidoreductase [Sphingomonadaceae bacterium]
MADNEGRRLRYAIIGAGMAGILAAIRLNQRGDADFSVFEKADRLGGTWRENRYPGLTCDVPAHAYTYSFAPYAEWSAYYSSGAEILTYFEWVAREWGVASSIRYGHEVTGCMWDDTRACWTLTFSNGGQAEADVVVAASGVLHHPNIPDIEGLKDFSGKAFHSAQWDDEADLDGKRVGIIGSGSTGIQLLTALYERAEKLVHFQRSPQWIMPVPQFEYSDAEREAFRKDVGLIDAIRNDPEYWANVMRFTDGITDFDSPQMLQIEEICRQNLEGTVKDAVLREKLRPDYRAACKRLIYSWQYYDCVQAPNVEVETGRIARIEAEGVRMEDGTFHELDVLVLATGFLADRFIRPAVVSGREGRLLDEFWAERPTAYYAVTLPEFPNFFMLNGPTGPVGNFSLIDIAERQWDYLDQLAEPLRTGDARWVEPRAEAFADYEERRIESAKKTIFGSGCSSWYLDKTGIPATWPWTYQAFADAMAAPVWSDYHLEPNPANQET